MITLKKEVCGLPLGCSGLVWDGSVTGLHCIYLIEGTRKNPRELFDIQTVWGTDFCILGALVWSSRVGSFFGEQSFLLGSWDPLVNDRSC